MNNNEHTEQNVFIGFKLLCLNFLILRPFHKYCVLIPMYITKGSKFVTKYLLRKVSPPESIDDKYLFRNFSKIFKNSKDYTLEFEVYQFFLVFNTGGDCELRCTDSPMYNL